MTTVTKTDPIKTITTHYIDGAFVESHGQEVMDIIRPTDGQLIGRVTLGDEEDTRRAAAMRARPQKTQPSLPLADYAGKYFDPLVGETQIVLGRDGKLTLAMQPNATLELAHWSFDSFEAADTRAPQEDHFMITFARGADGRITGYETEGGRRFRRR